MVVTTCSKTATTTGLGTGSHGLGPAPTGYRRKFRPILSAFEEVDLRRAFGLTILIGLFLCWVSQGCNTAKDAGDTTAPPSSEDSVARQPTDLVPFAVETPDGDRYGYRDAAGQVGIEPKFLSADNFSAKGLAAVVDESGWAYINPRGEVVVRPFVFDNGPDPFSDGLARFEQDGRFGFFDETGTRVIEPRFDFARPFSEGLAAVCSGCVRKSDGEHWFVSGGKWGYIGKSGDIAIELVFDVARPFEGGRAEVVEAGKTKSIGPDGKTLP